MTNDTAVQAFLDYLNESDEPEIYWPRHHFEESCFSRWAAWEMIEAIMDHPMEDPEDVIEEFTMKMVIFSSIADGTDEGRIFSIAAAISCPVWKRAKRKSMRLRFSRMTLLQSIAMAGVA